MRLSVTVLAAGAFLLAGALSGLAARVAVSAVEERSVDAVQDQLVLEGFDWARVLGDGLQVILEGEAPTEAERFRAMSIAGGIVDASRVIDNIQVKDTARIAAPDFRIEILRNDSGVSLIGLIPATTDREALNAEIARIAGGAPVTDLLQAADYPVPAGWRPSLAYALDALGRLPRSKISVGAGHVAITAISDSVTEQRRIEADLARRAPEGVTIALSVSAPRPVISPFTVRFSIDDRGPHFDACAADSEQQRDQIIAAALAAGAEGRLDCTLALGVPTRRWGDAVAISIAALAEIGQGTVTFSDADVVLVAAEGSDRAVFDRVVGELANALPDVFALEAILPETPDAEGDGPTVFTATLSPEGQAQVRGRVHDELMNETVANFARAQFGADKVTMGTRIDPEGLPAGWSLRVLTGIEALSLLANGAVTVLPDRVTISGQTGNAQARDEIARLFIDKLGQDARFEIEVAYVEALDPIAGLPTPEECVSQIRAVTVGRKITFEPGSATLNLDAMPIIDDIAEVLRMCGDLRLRISGFTDSQGRDEMNLELSQDRAESVLDALRGRRVPVAAFEAVGYGEANPIADNETEEGREANRRIEFSLMVPEGQEGPGTLVGLAAQPGEVAAGDAAVVEDLPVTERPETRPRARPEERPDLSSVAVEPEVEGEVPDDVEGGEAGAQAATAAVEGEGATVTVAEAGAPDLEGEGAGQGIGADASVPSPAAAEALAAQTPDGETETPAALEEPGEQPAAGAEDVAAETGGAVAPAADEVGPSEPESSQLAAPEVADPEVPEAAEGGRPGDEIAEPAGQGAAAQADDAGAEASGSLAVERAPFENAMDSAPESRPRARPGSGP